MRGCGRAQFACESKLAVVIEVVLVAEKDHFVLQERLVDRRDRLGIEFACQPYAVNAGTDVGAQFHHVEEFSHRSIPTRDGCAVNDLAGRDPNSRPDDKSVNSVNTWRVWAYCSAIRPPGEGVTVSEKRSLRVAIIGAGMSGLCMAAKLQDAGIETFTIFEKADEVGGTWRDNTYPGSVL